VDRTIGGNVKQDTPAEQGLDATTRALSVNPPQTDDAGPGAQALLPPDAIHEVVVGDIPQEPPGFVPRTDLMARLDQAGARVAVIHAVTGLRGVGTTQLAAAYARAKLAAGWRLVAWVNAADTDSLRAGLAAVADAMGLTDTDSGRPAADVGGAVRRALEIDGDHCLLVFDDAADPEALRPLIPAHGTARVLITSSRPPPANLAVGVPVDVIGTDQALRYLNGRTGLDDAAGAAAVAAVLGHLPLALALAAPVIERQHHGYARYLDRLQTIPVDVFLTEDDGQSYPHSVARTVLLSLAVIRAADPTGMCTRVMEIIAVLAATGVRRGLLHAAGQAGALARDGRRVEPAVVDRVLEWLSDQSVVTFSLDGQTIIMPRQVARVVRGRLARRQRLGAVCWAAASALEAHATAVSSAQDRWAARTVPLHVTALLDTTPRLAGKAEEDLALILLSLRFIAFHHLIELGDDTAQAIATGELLTADLDRALGPDDPDTLSARNSLAAAYLAAGRTAQAIPLFEQTLAIQQGLLGPHDPETLTSRNNLAAAYQDAGRADEAIRLFEQVLSTRERLLGADHPSTLNSRGNLAAAYRDGNRAAEAIPLFEQTLADRERVLGPDHPDTQLSRKNLANAYRDAGRIDAAVPLFDQLLAGRKHVPRRDHPDVQATRRDRAAAAVAPAEQARAGREGQPPADAAGQLVRAGLRRPPAAPARRTLPSGFRRPPAGPARRPRPAAGRTVDRPPTDVQDDQALVAAMAAGDPTGIAQAYDRYAAALFGYCYWFLRDTAAAADALADTFVITVATISDLPEPSKLRPRLYAVARSECRRRVQRVPAGREEGAGAADRTDDAGQPAEAAESPIDATMSFRVVGEPAYEPIDATMSFRVVGEPVHEPIDATMPIRVVSQSIDATAPMRVLGQPIYEPAGAAAPRRAASEPAHAAAGPTHANGDSRQAELRTLVRSLLVDLKPREREVVELSYRHDLVDNDLAIALGVSPSRAHGLASRAVGLLEKSLGAVHAALAVRHACPVLGELLVDWDGRLTEQTLDLAGWHIEQCSTCAHYRGGALRPAALPQLLPLTPLPAQLREQVLRRCCATTEDEVTHRRRVVRHAESTWFALFAKFSQAVGWLRWRNIRANHGVAVAAIGVAAWAAAAVIVLLSTFAGVHAARALETRPGSTPPASSPARPAGTRTAAPFTAPTSVSASPTPTFRPSPSYVPPSYVPPASPTLQAAPSPSSSPSPTPSASPSASKSPSPSPSPSGSPSSSPSGSTSPSQTPSPSPSPTPSKTRRP